MVKKKSNPFMPYYSTFKKKIVGIKKSWTNKFM